MKHDERKCPRCAEVIKIDALKCKHCGAEFSEAEVKELKRKNNRQAAGGCLVVLIIFAIFIALVSTCSGSGGGNTADNASVDSSEPVKLDAATKKLLAEQSKTMWSAILSASSACDRDSEAVTKVVGGGNVYEAYPVVENARSECMDAALAIGRVAPPAAATGDVKTAFETAISRCSDGYSLRSSAYKTMAKAIDGDARPSVIQEAKESMDSSAAMVMGCGVSIIEAASKADIDPAFLKTK